ADPVVLCAGARVGGAIRGDAVPRLVERRGAEEVDRVQELAVLQQVAVAVPQAGDDVPVMDDDGGAVRALGRRLGSGPGTVSGPGLGVTHLALIGKDAGEAAVAHGEAPRGRPVGVLGPYAAVAVRAAPITTARGGRGRRVN